jgi:hypothetical protein
MRAVIAFAALLVCFSQAQPARAADAADKVRGAYIEKHCVKRDANGNVVLGESGHPLLKFKSRAGLERCLGDAEIAAARATNSPFVDLAIWATAQRVAVAERLDRKEITQAQFDAADAEIHMRAKSEAHRRMMEEERAINRGTPPRTFDQECNWVAGSFTCVGSAD